ncbi:hypothetical protein PRIC1_001586 [Phytophthora ramorum]
MWYESAEYLVVFRFAKTSSAVVVEVVLEPVADVLVAAAEEAVLVEASVASVATVPGAEVAFEVEVVVAAADPAVDVAAETEDAMPAAARKMALSFIVDKEWGLEACLK